MSANTILTSIVTGGTNSHATVAEEANSIATDFVTSGVVGALTLNSGSGGTGSYCVNADSSPDMGVAIKAGQAYIAATPAGQNSQVLRARASTDYTAYTINANASGSTKYDWIYLSVSASNANTPSASADNVTSIVTSRSSSNLSDNGSPPTYGLVLAVVTVANGASSITNGNITDKRVNALVGSANSSLTTFTSEATFDYVASGLIITGDSYASTLLGSITSGVVYIGGARNIVGAVAGHTFGASLDTYIDVLYSSTGTGTIVYTTASNNAASPALAASSIRIGIVVTGGTSIAAATSINQGQEERILPISSSVPYAVTDSLGNLICPRDPLRRTLGYRQVSALQNTITTEVDLTGLSVPFIVPANRRIRATFDGAMGNSASDTPAAPSIKEGSTYLQGRIGNTGTAGTYTFCFSYETIPTSGLHTYKMVAQRSAGSGSVNLQASAATNATNGPAYLRVELI